MFSKVKNVYLRYWLRAFCVSFIFVFVIVFFRYGGIVIVNFFSKVWNNIPQETRTSINCYVIVFFIITFLAWFMYTHDKENGGIR